jgi:hypothetical protein
MDCGRQKARAMLTDQLSSDNLMITPLQRESCDVIHTLLEEIGACRRQLLFFFFFFFFLKKVNLVRG